MNSFSDFLMLLPWFLATEAIGLLLGWWLWGGRKRRFKKLQQENQELQARYEAEKKEWTDAHVSERRGTASVVAELKELRTLAQQQEEIVRQTQDVEARYEELLAQQAEASETSPRSRVPVSRLPTQTGGDAVSEELQEVIAERDTLARKLKMYNAFGSMEDDLKAKIEALKEENTLLFRMLEDFEAERFAAN